MFPDAANWTVWNRGELYYFRRGSGSMSRFVTHGTPLSIAYDIIRDGIRVGSGTHGGKKGFFCIDGGDEMNRVRDARDRSTANRCTGIF